MAGTRPHGVLCLGTDTFQTVAQGLGDAAAGWPLIVIDTTDEAGVRDLAARTTVVVTTVGPYVKYGTALAAACAAAGTHYCDLTGEVLVVHQSIAANHELAKQTGARIGRASCRERVFRAV